MRDYTIPVVPMATEKLEQVTTGFKRVNSGGSKMSEVHMVNALTWSRNFDLLERLDDLGRSLTAQGWGSFEPQMIMNICKARFGLDIYKTSAEELARGLKDEPDALAEVHGALLMAARMLETIASIRGPLALPYSYQAVLLADALHREPKPDTATEQALREWFWLTTLTEYFQSMTGSLFRRAQEHLRALVAGKASPRPPDLADTIGPLTGFDYRSARSRAMALLLAGLDPRPPGGDADFDAGLTLAEHGNDALPRLLGRHELTPSSVRGLAGEAANRFLLPPREGQRLRDALHAEGAGADELAQRHAIPPAALAALRSGDFTTFLSLRQAHLRELERARAEEVGLTYLDSR